MVENLEVLLKKLKITGKLRRAVMKQEGWSDQDWYTRWPEFSKELIGLINEGIRSVSK